MTPLVAADPTIVGVARAQWVWATKDEGGATKLAGDVPVGVLLDHGDHTFLVPWVAWDGQSPPPCTLDSLLPLTVVELVRCTICGIQGRIEKGAWQPVEDGQL